MGPLNCTPVHQTAQNPGGDLTLEQGREAARMTALSILATLQAELGDLGRIQRIIKVFGMVNVAPFDLTPAVIDGCSDLQIRPYNRPGRHRLQS